MERSQFIKFIGTIPYGPKVRAGLIAIYDKIAKIAGIDKASQSEDGLMSKEDKKKLDGIAENANNYTHPTNAGNKHIPAGGSDGQFLKWKADGEAQWSNDNNTTYSKATDTTLGLVKIGYTTSDKNYAVQLDGDGKMFVNVPWTDTNTTYNAATTEASGLVKQAAKVDKPSDNTNDKLKAAIDKIIDAMIAAGQMKA